MRPGLAMRATTALLLTGMLPCAAQEPPERWHLQGSLGLNLNDTTSTLLHPPSGSKAVSEQAAAAGDLRFALDGFLKDPKLLPFNVDFNGERGSNSLDVGSYRDAVLGWGLSTIFLPQRSFPLRFYYRKSQFGSSGSVFEQNADNSAMGLDWALRLPRLRRVNLTYTRLSHEIRVPTSLTDTGYHEKAWHFSTDDEWRSWEWNAGFDNYSSVSNSLGGTLLSSGFQDNLRVLGLAARRSFWQKKAEFSLEDRSEWRHATFGSLGTTEGSNNNTHAFLRLKLTPKLSSNYFYSFTRVRLHNGSRLASALPTNLLTGITLIDPPAFVSHYAGGRVDYRFTGRFRLFEEVRYQRLRPPPTKFEVRRSLTESLSGFSYQQIWRGIEFGSTYAGHWQTVGTNLDNRANTWSNDFEGRVGWGDIRRVRFLGIARQSRLNLVEQLGGFSEDRHFRLEAETAFVPRLRLRFNADRSRIELLNISGDTKQDYTNLGFQAEHARFSLALSRTFGEGAGALFPETVRFRRLIGMPLPLDELIATPLLNRTTRANGATLILRLRRQLDLSAYWRTERDLFAASNLNYRLAEVRARYRLGKLTFEAGLGEYRTEILTGPGPGGTNITRYFLRVIRDLRIF